ncbi:MAG TPA: hypothetical protein ENL28_01610 [Candidatus Atribacteria bacterium]|nr:hypothetical protein [Candidatus Atribacteria bacterium]
MILGLLLSILVLYGLLLFWIVNERVKEIAFQVRKVREEVQGMSAKFDELKRLLTTKGGELSADSASFSFEMLDDSKDDSEEK